MTDNDRIATRLRSDIRKAHWEAWNGLARMKWSQFGYWAAAWVRDNRKVVGDDIRTIRSRPSPFKILTEIARAVRAELDAGYDVPKITFAVERRFEFSEEMCPNHVASAHDGKVCRRCGIHIDALRPLEEP